MMNVGRNVKRYTPFLALAALQLAYFALAPVSSKPAAGTAIAAGGDASVAAGDASGGATGSSTGGNADLAGASGGGTAAAAASGGSGGGGGGGAASGKSGSTAGGGAAATAGGPAQKLDFLGRPLDGDRSKCGAGGVWQDTVTSYSIPCVPKFVGDNGGSTYQGVTKDSITVVYYNYKANPTVNQALATQGLSVSDAQSAEILKIFETWFNKHYEFYGRQLKLIQYNGDCDGTDPVCIRNDVDKVNKLYHPFAIQRFEGTPEFADEASRLKIPVLGSSWTLARSFFQQRGPYVWDFYPDAETVAANMSDYWCKKLEGNNATFAGDPTLQVKKRRLGLIVPEDPPEVWVAQLLQKSLGGGQCGTPDNKPLIYTTSTDANTAQNQLPTLVAKMKNDGVTTASFPVCTFAYLLLVTPTFDRQQYYPEHFLSGTGACDHDLVGRFATPTQWSHAFGPSYQPKGRPASEQDDYKAVKEMQPTYDYNTYVMLAVFIFTRHLVFLIQQAGPTLTPENMDRGARAQQQIGGWTNAKPWPGWKCCDPFVTQGTFPAGRYTWTDDAKAVYWDPQAASPIDGKPGTYVCVPASCQRWSAGNWPAGSPKGG